MLATTNLKRGDSSDLRYAHTRLHKQRASVRRRVRAANKRAQRDGGNRQGSYGTVNAKGNGGSNRYGMAEHDNSTNSNEDDDTAGETDALSRSFDSSASTQADEADGDEGEAVMSKTSTTYLQSPYWWLGQVLITLGEMGNFLAYGFAPASIVSPLGVVALVSNCLIAPLMFHERFRHRDFWGVVVAVGGVVTVVLSANTQENKLKPGDIRDAITSLEFEIYLGVTVFLIAALAWASPRYGKNNILIDLGLVGLFGGYTVLATKGVSSMLSSTLWRAFATPVTYALLFILLATAIMQIRYVNKALQHFDSTQVIPIQFVMFTLCVILGSAILYRDFEHTTAKQAGKFVGGCLLTFFGVFLITSGRDHGHDDEDGEDGLSETDDVEETIGLARRDSAQHTTNGDQRSTPGSAVQSSRSSRAAVSRPRSPEYESDAISPWTSGPGDGAATFSPEASAPLLGSNPWGLGETHLGNGDRTRSADTLIRGGSIPPLPPTGHTPAAATTTREGLLAPSSDQQLLVPSTPPSRHHSVSSAAHRHSGPFISPSPLASTVTTVMKDAFLMENRPQLPVRSSMRNIRSRIRASLFFDEDEDGNIYAPLASEDSNNLAHDQPSALPPPPMFNPSDAGTSRTRLGPGFQEGNGGNTGRTRSRSLSDALSEFFHPRKKHGRDGEYDHEESGA
ncbi:Pfam:DUF803 [Geosmithia morbida]|uniref:Pfam:DUF803 n=1 Tax=Geosmithia morbida TaxID=1094350 RepID=A0A9P4YRI6_9HYPO|nr:Pfam:DUF803 [Geosmithia morbida]KAF4120296.1 Pfam:DUF803 [Geosmithia morbida]